MIQSKPFSIPRGQLVRAASHQYLRRMWPIFVAFPLFGLIAILFGPNRFVQALGLLAFAWPFTIPARVALASWGKARRLMQETVVSLEKGVLYFQSASGGGMKLPLDQLRRVDSRGEFYVFETKRFNFALIPRSALAESDRARFEKAISLRGA